MKTLLIDGKEVKTNYGSEYPRLPDDMNATALPFGMTFQEFLKRAVEDGYTKVTFYHTTTRVRGYHKYYANCKRG